MSTLLLNPETDCIRECNIKLDSTSEAAMDKMSLNWRESLRTFREKKKKTFDLIHVSNLSGQLFKLILNKFSIILCAAFSFYVFSFFF